MPALLSDPNPDMTGYDLIYATVVEWCLYGRCVWAVGRDASSASGWQARLIPCAWVTNRTGSNGFSFSELEFSDPETGAVYRLPASRCVTFQSYRPGAPASALSPVESLRQTLAEQIEAQEFRRGVWKNGTQITGYISRPAGVEWGDGAAERFKRDIRDNWTGGGAHAGGVPVLEDGMDYHAVEFNARERDWASGVKLSREDCAAAFHVNPSVIWPGEGQTYASAKDNARALYAESLFPVLRMLAERIGKSLAPMVGAPAGEYAEFDISVKLQASFEERTAAMQTAVGGPWMTRQEARAQMNMAREPDGDLITPLNVLVGGLASPTDTAPKGGYVQEPEGPGRACGCAACKALGRAAPAPAGRKAAADPFDDEVGGYRDALASFYARQRRSVLSRMGADPSVPESGDPSWFDSGRWDGELSDALLPAVLAGSEASAGRTLDGLGLDRALYDPARARAFLEALARSRAEMVNASTLAQLIAALAGELGDGAQGSTPAGVFDRLESSGAERQAASIATSVAGWSAIEAARQCAPAGSVVTKTWVTGRNPRPGHLAMNGETVPIDRPFSNGAMWPGDARVLPASQVANCNCTVEITVLSGSDGTPGKVIRGESAIAPTDVSWDSKKLGPHINSHAREFGLDVQSAADREEYVRIANSVIRDYDQMGYATWPGQYTREGISRRQVCACYLQGDSFVVVNIETKRIVTLFKYEEGRSEQADKVWNTLHG